MSTTGPTLKPLSRCCTNGFIHEGVITGSFTTIDDIQCYYVYPDSMSSERAIILLSDAMGHRFINTQLLADNFAANGYFVVVPDLFHGDSIPLNRGKAFDTLSWRKRHLPERVDPVIHRIVTGMREVQGCKSIAGVGYCFGATYVVRHLKAGRLDVGFIAHPLPLEDEALLGIEKPLSVAAAALDDVFGTAERHKAEHLLKRNENPYQVTVYSQVEHGFAVRADDADAHAKFSKEQAFLQAVQWIDQYMP